MDWTSSPPSPPNSLLSFSPLSSFSSSSSAEEKKRGQSCFSPPSPMGGRRRRRWEKEEGEEKSLFGGFVAATALALGLGLRGRFGSGGRAEGNAGGLPNKVCRSRTRAMSTNVRKSSIVPKKKAREVSSGRGGWANLMPGLSPSSPPPFSSYSFLNLYSASAIRTPHFLRSSSSSQLIGGGGGGGGEGGRRREEGDERERKWRRKLND